MLKTTPAEPDALGRGAYSAVESLRLLNFNRPGLPSARRVSRQTVARWLRGYSHGESKSLRSEPLWKPDYQNEDDQIELSFRDLIELRFVKTFRDLGVGLKTIRDCYRRAVDEIHDDRPFSTQRFRTDGKTIFLEITERDHNGRMIDLKKKTAGLSDDHRAQSSRSRIRCLHRLSMVSARHAAAIRHHRSDPVLRPPDRPAWCSDRDFGRGRQAGGIGGRGSLSVRSDESRCAGGN
jgi:hypothetical protein